MASSILLRISNWCGWCNRVTRWRVSIDKDDDDWEEHQCINCCAIFRYKTQ